MAFLSALSQRTADDPHRWFILHELAKRIKNEELARLLLEAVGEVRHRPLSYLLETHFIGELPAELVQKMSGISQLPRGVCYGAFRTATDPLLMRIAQEINIRPSTVWAKGETQQVA